MSLVLTSTFNMGHDELLETRSHGVGDSDVVGICLPNNYKSPTTVYLDKVGAIEKRKNKVKLHVEEMN